MQFPPLVKISCLLVTAGYRWSLVRRSIQCYLTQTYPNKELVIVNEGPPEYQEELRAYVESLQRSDIKGVWLNEPYTLGALRNIAIWTANGEIFCQWDDDDFCLPQRLSVQYAHLVKHGSRACYLGDQLHYYFDSGTLYWESWAKYGNGGLKKYSIIPGTLMAWSDCGVRYPAVGSAASVGEDSVFAEKLLEKQSVSILQDRGYLHVYTYHGKNVHHLEHHTEISKVRRQPREYITKYKDQICRTIDHLQLPGEVKIMCQDGLVFVHHAQIAEN